MKSPDSARSVQSIVVTGSTVERQDEILTPAALDFVATLVRESRDAHDALMRAREERHRRFAAGELPGFLPETEEIRTGDWQVAAQPADLLKRTVEITGPVSRKILGTQIRPARNVFACSR